MLELTGMGSVLRGIGWLYWLLAAGAIYLAIRKGKGRRAKIAWTLAAIAVFSILPVKQMIERAKRDAYAREAWAYFKKKCDTEAGEKIYKTYTGVKSVLVIKPLPPATEKDLFDQFWYGDPYSNATPWNKRDVSAADTLLRQMILFDRESAGFEFVEIEQSSKDGRTVEQISPSPEEASRILKKSMTRSVSRFGLAWEDISTPEDRKYWVAGSRLGVIDLIDKSVVAERIGYLIESGFGSTAGQRRPWLTSRGPNTTCPSIRNGTYEDRLFVLKVLKPPKGAENGK